MTTTTDTHLDLVIKAKAGDRESLQTLLTLVQERVYPYINRVVLNEDTAQDLLQEIHKSIFESLDKLKRADRFWSWVFSIATNRIRQHYRNESVHRVKHMSEIGDAYLQIKAPNQMEGISAISKKELAQLTRAAMSRLSERYRMVLALRFYEDMPHGQIAKALGCTELSVRATFFRAKRALKKELRRNGLHKSAFIAALIAFGQATVQSEAAAAAVTVSTTAVAEAVLTGILSVKAKLTAAAIIAFMALALLWDMDTSSSKRPKSKVKYIHFVHQSPDSNKRVDDRVDFGSLSSKGAYEQWYHFPQGNGGPFFFRMQRWDPRQTTKLCSWVQNSHANFYCNVGTGIIHINNYRLYYVGHGTKTLPTDPRELCEFIRKVEGDETGSDSQASLINYNRDPGTGNPASRLDKRFKALGDFKTVYDYSEIPMNLFNSPVWEKMADDRDEMHKRGWTYFRIAGRLDDRTISGTGRLPFVYNTCKSHYAWLELKLDGKPVAVDDGKLACMMTPDGNVRRVYPGGSLFKGLSRPWVGFHTMDIIRRDAAREKIMFSTAIIEPHVKVNITIVDDSNPIHYRIRYTVDVENDLLEKIVFWMARDGIFDRASGEMTFSYLNEVDGVGDEFSGPQPVKAGIKQVEANASVLWPIYLAQSTVEKKLASIKE
ncbi:MAG: RNA polymerase sigma factor [Planctomycetota bacterium]|jgi:RNA polymerase sigma-70 factor (ECF subfamily)